VERRAFAVAALNLLVAGAAWGQGATKHYRLGIISAGSPRSTAFYAAFEARLLELGWSDGKNLTVDFEAGEGPERLSVIAKRMVRDPVDAIVTVGPEPALKAASDATRTIPIVCVALNYDPVERGYATSLARPGRNITGVFFRNPEIGPKQLEFLRQAIPRASRVGVLWTGFSADQVPPLDAEASRLRLRLEKIKLDPPYDIEGTFAALKARGVDVVLAVGDPVLYRERGRIARAGLARGLAVVGGNSGVEVGFLMGFGPDLDATVKRGAEYVDAIFRGGKVAEMPIEQPTKFELKINLKTAKALGITIPKPLLLRADEVIQ
jgi:putative ABC transport system substrate-binding protein